MPVKSMEKEGFEEVIGFGVFIFSGNWFVNDFVEEYEPSKECMHTFSKLVNACMHFEK